MGRIILLLPLLFPFVTIGQSTNISFAEIFSVKGVFNEVSVDNGGNVYLLQHQNTLFKYDSKGILIGSFNYKNANITSFDTRNPVKVLLFFQDIQTVILADNKLKQQKIIKPDKTGSITAAALANDGTVLVFDEQTNIYKKIADDGKTVFESLSLRAFLNNQFHPTCITDNTGGILLFDSVYGWRLADYYTMKNTFHHTASLGGRYPDNPAAVKNDNIHVQRNDDLVYIFPSPVKKLKQLYWTRERWYLLTEERLFVMKNPFADAVKK